MGNFHKLRALSPKLWHTVYMKCLLSLVALLLLPVCVLAALDISSIEKDLQKSLDVWDLSAPWVRMGKAPVMEEIDPGEILMSIREDLARKSRLEEFSYLFDMYNRMNKSGLLTIGVIEDIPPTPGFWPVRREGQRRGIVINSRDRELLQADPDLYRSSFLRALAVIYYENNGAPLNSRFRQRNFLVEVAAFMTGFHVESIYLSEILDIHYSKGPASGYYELLLRSARENDLRELAFVLFGVDLNYVYSVINNLRGLKDIQYTGNLLQYYDSIPDSILYDASRLSFLPEPNLGLLDKGIFIRSVVLAVPWLFLDLHGKIPETCLGLRETMDKAFAQYAPVLYAYRYGDVPVLKQQILNLNMIFFRPPEQDVVEILTKEANRTDTTPQQIDWYYYYGEKSLFQPDLRLRMAPERVERNAAYGVVYTNNNQVDSILYRIQGVPEDDVFLDGAATIQFRRDGSRELRFWKNEYGTIENNRRGYAVMIGDRDEDGTGIMWRFYDRKGHRVRDCSGAWQIRIQDCIGEKQDIVFLDAAGRELLTVYGFARERRIAVSKKETHRLLFDCDGAPVVGVGSDYHFSKTVENRTDDSIVLEYYYYDTARQPVSVPGQAPREIFTATRTQTESRLLDAEGNPMLCSAGFAVQTCEYRNGLLTELYFSNTAGEPAYVIDGFSSVEYEYNSNGRIQSYSFFDIYGNPVKSSSGFHKKTFKMEPFGYVREIQHLDIDGSPAQDERQTFRVRIYLDEQGLFDHAEVWDARGNLLNSPAGEWAGNPAV